MYVGRDFPPMNPDESVPLTFNFTNDLPSGDTISSVVFDLTVIEGTDANPSSHLDGVAGISGVYVTQRITELEPGNIYCLSATVTTAQTNVLTLWSRVACQEAGA